MGAANTAPDLKLVVKSSVFCYFPAMAGDSEPTGDAPQGQFGLANANANFNMNLGDMFGGSSYNQSKRASRKSYEHALRYQPGITSANAKADIMGKLAAAREGGLHPLFALGSSAGGGSPAFEIGGQSPTGSFRDIGATISTGSRIDPNQKEITKQQARLLKAQADQEELLLSAAKNQPVGAGPGTEPVTTTGARIMKEQTPVITHKVDSSDKSTAGIVEYVPPEQFHHAEGDRSVNPADMQFKRKLWTTNDTWMWMPNVQELDSLMEEPIVALGALAALNPQLTTNQIKAQLRGLGYVIEDIGVVSNKRIKTWQDPFGLIKIYKDIPYKSRGRYPK